MRRAGTFLVSKFPRKRSSDETIGVALASSLDASVVTHQQWLVHRILETAAARNLATKVAYLPVSKNADERVEVERAFGASVEGLISFVFFDHPNRREAPHDSLPIVFLGSSRQTTRRPCVVFDLRRGSYLLTKRLIELGHRNILLWVEKATWPHSGDLMRVRGFERAMAEAGIPVDQKALDEFLAVGDDLHSLHGYLEAHRDATALMCLSPQKAREAIGMARILGWRVPEDISVAGNTLKPPDLYEGAQGLGGACYDFDDAIEQCLDILLRQIRTGRPSLVTCRFAPMIRDGRTMGPARKAMLSGPCDLRVKAESSTGEGSNDQ